MSIVARVFHVLLLGLWLGGGAFLITVVAPGAFGLITSPDEAGKLVAQMVTRLDFFAIGAGPLILITLFAGWVPLRAKVGLRAAGGVVMTAAACVSGLFLSPRLLAARDAEGQFGTLQALSQVLVTVHVLLALSMLIAAVVSSPPRSRGLGIQL